MKKVYSATFKAQLVLELLKETKTISELAAEYQLHPNVLRVVAECRMVDTCTGGNASNKRFTRAASRTSICAGFLHYSAIRTDVSRSHA
jgi:transposase-like protein